MWITPKTNWNIKEYINLEDINRIEGDCDYIAQELKKYGYVVSITTKTSWTIEDFPYLIEINRIRDNVNALLNAYYTLAGSIEIRYWESLDWTDVNSLEQNLFNLNVLLELMKASFRYSGTFQAGQEVL